MNTQIENIKNNIGKKELQIAELRKELIEINKVIGVIIV